MSHKTSNIEGPTQKVIRKLAEQSNIVLTDEEVEMYHNIVQNKTGVLEKLEDLRHLVEDSMIATEAETREYRDPELDKYNSWISRCSVKGESTGILDEYDLAIKDNIAVAGVPMTCSSKALEDYIPQQDAFVVKKLLQEGGTIVGKANMDEMAVTGTGEATIKGRISNPHDSEYLAGGSSGGCAVAIANEEVEMALGTDQAGSARIPAAWCGCVGMKPTFGLISYRGAVPLGYSFDHIGPMGRTVEDIARLLTAIKAEDKFDPRQRSTDEKDYLNEINDLTTEQITIGVLEEGLYSKHTSEDVENTIHRTLEKIRNEGADIEEVSIPLHNDAPTIGFALEIEATAAMWESEGMGKFTEGWYDTQFGDKFAKVRRTSFGEFGATVQYMMMLGMYLREQTQSRYYALANNLRYSLKDAYDEILKKVDVLVLPTTPMLPFEKRPIESQRDLIDRTQGKVGRIRNTIPFNLTGHPVISIPVGDVDGLPVGMSIVGSHFSEKELLQIAKSIQTYTNRKY